MGILENSVTLFLIPIEYNFSRVCEYRQCSFEHSEIFIAMLSEYNLDRAYEKVISVDFSNVLSPVNFSQSFSMSFSFIACEYKELYLL